MIGLPISRMSKASSPRSGPTAPANQAAVRFWLRMQTWPSKLSISPSEMYRLPSKGLISRAMKSSSVEKAPLAQAATGGVANSSAAGTAAEAVGATGKDRQSTATSTSASAVRVSW